MTDLIENFAENWEEEVEKQESSSKRLREILMRWGEFSNEFVKEARLLKQENEESGWMWKSLGKLVGLSIIGPILSMVPFVLKVTDDCVGSLVGHSVWFGGTSLFFPAFTHLFFRPLHRHCTHTVIFSVNALLAAPILNYAFLSVPFGWHTLRFYLYCVVVNGSLAFLFRLATSDRGLVVLIGIIVR